LGANLIAADAKITKGLKKDQSGHPAGRVYVDFSASSREVLIHDEQLV